MDMEERPEIQELVMRRGFGNVLRAVVEVAKDRMKDEEDPNSAHWMQLQVNHLEEALDFERNVRRVAV